MVDYLVSRDEMILECKPYSDLKEHDSKRVLNLFNDLRNRNKYNIYLCELCFGGKCKYISYISSKVRGDIASKHLNQSISIIKIIAYPGFKAKNLSRLCCNDPR